LREKIKKGGVDQVSPGLLQKKGTLSFGKGQSNQKHFIQEKGKREFDNPTPCQVNTVELGEKGGQKENRKKETSGA